MSLNILNIFNKLKFIIDESILWSILSCGLTLIQNKISSGDYDLVLLTLENLHITAEGQICLKKDVNEGCSRMYLAPEIIDINDEWFKVDDLRKAEILLYSLGISLKKCLISGKNDISIVSDTLQSIVTLIIEHSVAKRLTLVEVLRICCSKAKDFTKGRSYSSHLSELYQSYKSTEKGSRMVRSLSQSYISSKNPHMISIKQKSLGSIHINGDQAVRNNMFNRNSSTDSENYNHCQSTGMSSPLSNASENNSTKETLATSNYGNLILNAIDPRYNITEAFERVKARRKVIKSHGPVKLPTEISLSSKDLVESFDKTEKCSERVQSQESLEISTIKRIGGFRHLLGPEFAMRINETFNITFTKEKRNSLFARTSSGRFIRDEINIHLLNGVVLIIKNLDNKSTVNHIINSIHLTFPDFEFVSYGLCFTLDSEYFFLKENINIFKLISYISHKNNQLKQDEKIDFNNTGLHLYYRLKFYPTLDMFREMNPFSRRLVYLQLRQDLLIYNRPPLNWDDAMSLAGAAIQTEYGDNDDIAKENLDYMKMQYYFHPLFISVFNTLDNEIFFLRKLQSNWMPFEWSESEAAYIEKVMSKKYYGLHWYRVNKNQLSIIGASGTETFLVLGRHYIELVDVSRGRTEIEIHKHFNYKWRQVDSIIIKNKKLIIKPKMQLKVEGMSASSVFVCYLDSRTKAEYIVRLCKDHHLLASQDEDINHGITNNVCNNTGSHLGLSMSDYPTSFRNSIDLNDDEIFIDYASSDEDISQNARNTLNNSPQYKLHQLKSLQSISVANREESDPNIALIGMTSNPSTTPLLSGSRSEYELTQLGSEINESKQLEKENVKLESPSFDNQYLDKIFEVEIIRRKGESFGIGIINVNTNDIQGIFIKCVQKNSIAEQCGQIMEGDEIISINNEPVSHITQDEVKTIMNSCGNNVLFLMRRHYSYLGDSLPGSPANNTTTSSKEISTLPSIAANIKREKVLKPWPLFKTDNSFYKCLQSSSSLESLRSNYTNIVVTPSQMKKENYSLIIKIESFSEKEIKGFTEKLKWSLKNMKLENFSVNNVFELTVNLNSLICQKLEYKVNVKFVMICARTKDDFNKIFWSTVNNNDSKLILSLGSKGFDKDLFFKKENLEKKYEVRVKESCEVSDTLTVRRLSLRLPNVDPTRIFQIQFCEWFNNKTNVDTMLQIVNLSCLLNLNIPNAGPVVIAYDDVNNKPTNFIVMFILVLLNLYSEISVAPVTNAQTLVNSIYNQLVEQSKDLIPSEMQFNLCISLLKILLPLGNSCEESPYNSDIE